MIVEFGVGPRWLRNLAKRIKYLERLGNGSWKKVRSVNGRMGRRKPRFDSWLLELPFE